MSNNKYDWSVLDKELIELYKADVQAVKKFVSKYGIDRSVVIGRLKKLGIKIRNASESKIGISAMEKNYNWKGGKYITKQGYVMICIGNNKYIPEHRLVMEKHLGRKLKSWEIPHHVDESFEGRSSNDINNLKLMTDWEHRSHHIIRGIDGRWLSKNMVKHVNN